MARFCSQCGTPALAGAHNCTQCGAALPAEPLGGQPTIEQPAVGAPPPPATPPPPASPPPPAAPGGPAGSGGGGANTALIVVVAVLATLVVAGLAFVLFGRDSGNDTPASTTVAPTTAVPTTSSSTTTTSTTTSTTAPTTTTTAAPTTTTTAAPSGPGDVLDEPAGLFCRDLKAKGYSYAAAVDYWNNHGQPDRMDADRNGIPCETVYPRSAVSAYWGSTDVPEYSGVPAGLLCRDLKARGFSYAEAAGYWFATGSPDNMDADRNGIPCETVYPASEVEDYWIG